MRVRGVATAETLARCVAHAGRHHPEPDALVLTGDLAHDDAGGYALLRERFADAAAPVHCLPGNHDEAATVRGALDGFVFHVVGEGEVRRLPDMVDPPRDKHQNWVLDVAANAWRVDVMLEPGDPSTWVFRKDEAVRAPRSFMVQDTTDGIPFLGPHGVLLYKAKAARPKDEADLAACLPRLAHDQRVWLTTALERVHPGHPWIDRVGP